MIPSMAFMCQQIRHEINSGYEMLDTMAWMKHEGLERYSQSMSGLIARKIESIGAMFKMQDDFVNEWATKNRDKLGQLEGNNLYMELWLDSRDAMMERYNTLKEKANKPR